jgi:hypothetical protein
MLQCCSSVTAEVASSSLVVPASFLDLLFSSFFLFLLLLGLALHDPEQIRQKFLHQPAFSLPPVFHALILANKVALCTEVSDTRVDGALAPEYRCCRGQSDQYSVRSEKTV